MRPVLLVSPFRRLRLNKRIGDRAKGGLTSFRPYRFPPRFNWVLSGPKVLFGYVTSPASFGKRDFGTAAEAHLFCTTAPDESENPAPPICTVVAVNAEIEPASVRMLPRLREPPTARAVSLFRALAMLSLNCQVPFSVPLWQPDYSKLGRTAEDKFAFKVLNISLFNRQAKIVADANSADPSAMGII